MAKHYMDDDNVRKYYDMWISSPTLLDHPMDEKRFYKFVKACIDYAGHENVARKLDTSILRLHLYDDLHDRCSKEYYDEITHKIIVLFEHLPNYEDTAFP